MTKMNAIISTKKFSSTEEKTLQERYWEAKLELGFTARNKQTRLVHMHHKGPLRVQRPFYPEKDGTCHIYLLHPPGGVVIGDDLTIRSNHQTNTQTLITTPSAGRIYSAKGTGQTQNQRIEVDLGNKSCVEWLPQETIIYNGANADLTTRINTTEDAKFIAWDMLRLGRRASGEAFTDGSCKQSLQVWQDQTPLFIERNHFVGDSELLYSPWGLQSASIIATLITNIKASKNQIDNWVNTLNEMGFAYDSNQTKKQWGLTQKREIFIARYLGDSITQCRNGMIYLWQQTRPLLSGKKVVIPRIWNT